MNMLNLLQRLAELDPQPAAKTVTTRLTESDDYGPYRGAAGDPRNDDASDDEIAAEEAQEMLSELKAIQDAHYPEDLTLADLPADGDLRAHFEACAQKMGVSLETHFDKCHDAVMAELEQDVKDGQPDTNSYRYENVNSPSDVSLTELAKLSGVKSKVAECGMGMPMTGSSQPANISITAGSGSELSSMLKDIMSLAGVHQVGPEHMPAVAPAKIMTISSPMRQMMDTMNEPADDETTEIGSDKDDAENEGSLGALAGGVAGGVLGGPLGALTGAAAGKVLTDSDDEEEAKEDVVRNNKHPMRQMMDKMDDEPKEELAYTPTNAHDVPEFENDKLAFNSNAGGDHRKRQAGLPSAMPVEEGITELTSKLYTAYQQFVNESNRT